MSEAAGDGPKEELSRRRRLAFAMGSAGFSLSDRIVYVVAIFFYLPPEGVGLPARIGQDIFFGGLTAFGVATMIGRLFDAGADPFVGYGSDRSRSRLGRRRSYLIYGIVPMTLLPVLIFFPPDAVASSANFAWLALVLALYYVAFTVYVAPYLALIPELAQGHAERVRLATLLAWVTFPVTIAFGAWTVGFDALVRMGTDPSAAIRAVVIGLAGASFAFCLLPILAIDERRHARSVSSDLPLGAAIRATLVNRPFVIYLVAQIFFILGVNLVQPVLTYYPRVILNRTEGFAAIFGLVLALATAGALPLVQRFGERFGAKRALVASVGTFAVALGLLGALEPAEPGTARDRMNLAILVVAMIGCGPPVAGFMVIPHVIISQLVDRDEARTGANRAAMFFGIQGLCTKFVYGISGAILAFLFARFGNSAEEPLGVLLVGPVAAGLCLVSALLYTLYPEHEVLSEAAGRGSAAEAPPPDSR